MKRKTQTLVFTAVIAALYAALTYLSSFFNLAYGPVQFRISEALTALAAFTPAAVPGLTLGCIIGNIASPYGISDVLLGAFATFSAAAVCRLFSKRFFKLSPFVFPFITALFNAVIVGLEISVFTPSKSFLPLFLITALQVGAGELAVCFVLGVPLFYALKKYFENKI